MVVKPFEDLKTAPVMSGEGMTTPPVPEGTSPLEHQVAGHRYGEGKTKLGFLQGRDGTILKPFQTGNRGLREHRFYRAVFDPAQTQPPLLALRRFVPPFCGLYVPPDVPGQQYLQLKDMTRGFSRPSIVDIKMGPVTYEPSATDEKKRSEVEKYPPALKLGFRIIGARIYSRETDSFTAMEKQESLDLNENNIVELGLRRIFSVDCELQTAAIQRVVCKMRDLEHWFEEQRCYNFIASSLLIIYEGAPSGNADVEVRMIDFTHVLKASTRDDNYLMGLKSLAQYLEELRTDST